MSFGYLMYEICLLLVLGWVDRALRRRCLLSVWAAYISIGVVYLYAMNINIV